MKEVLTSTLGYCIYSCILGIMIGLCINANIPKKKSKRIYVDNEPMEE